MSPFSWARTALLFRQYRMGLVRYLERYTGDRHIAEDVVQDTFLRLRERPPSTEQSMKGWLFTVATHLAQDRLRAEHRRARLVRRAPDRLPIGEPPEDPATRAERDETRGRIRAALARLSDKERTALLMREEGFRHREIADAVGTTTKSVGTLLTRAIAKLAANLRADD